MYKEDIKLNDDELTDTLPEPKGYKMLIALPSLEEKTDGGIHLTDEYVQREQTASIIGFVVKQGDLCYGDKDKFPSGKWCGQGDWIVFRAYSGTRFIYKNQEFRLINDDACEAVCSDPRVLKRAGASY